MPRIRTIKPEYWGDEKLAALAPIDRLVFLGLISMADDAGRLVDNAKTIDGFLFPSTDDSSRTSLETLTALGRLVRYASGSGQRLLQITNWEKHQKVNHPSSYTLPGPSKKAATPQAVTSDAPANESKSQDTGEKSSRDLLASTYDQRPTIYDQREAVDKSTGEPDGEPKKARNPHLDSLGALMPLIRQRFYQPDNRPPPDYDDGRDAGIVLALLRLGIGEGELRDAIEGAALLRDDGQLEEWSPPVRRTDKLTMRVLYHTKRGVLPMLTEATNYLDGKRKYATAPKNGHRRPTAIESLVVTR